MTELSNVLRRETIYIWYYFEIQFRQIFRYWILGMLIGSFISVFAKDKIHGIFAGMKDKKWGLFGIIPTCLLGIASPLCMYGTIPLLQQWLWEGMSLGSAAAFMITGPATKITNLGALKIAMGWKRFTLYMGFVMVFSFLCGMVVNLIL